jgi:hypothetical protein
MDGPLMLSLLTLFIINTMQRESEWWCWVCFWFFLNRFRRIYELSASSFDNIYDDMVSLYMCIYAVIYILIFPILTLTLQNTHNDHRNYPTTTNHQYSACRHRWHYIVVFLASCHHHSTKELWRRGLMDTSRDLTLCFLLLLLSCSNRFTYYYILD